MVYLRFIAVLGIMLMPASFAHATAQDDAYIAGYAAGVLKHDLKLDMPSLMVRDGVITFPVGGLEAADRAKAVQLLSEIPGVNAVKISEATSRQSMSPALQSLARFPVMRLRQQLKRPYCQQGFCPQVIYSSHYWQIRAGLISQRLTAITKATILMEEI